MMHYTLFCPLILQAQASAVLCNSQAMLLPALSGTPSKPGIGSPVQHYPRPPRPASATLAISRTIRLADAALMCPQSMSIPISIRRLHRPVLVVTWYRLISIFHRLVRPPGILRPVYRHFTIVHRAPMLNRNPVIAVGIRSVGLQIRHLQRLLAFLAPVATHAAVDDKCDFCDQDDEDDDYDGDARAGEGATA